MLNLEFKGGEQRHVFRARSLEYSLEVYQRDRVWTYSVWWLGKHVETSGKHEWTFFDVKLNAESSAERHMETISAERAKNGLDPLWRPGIK